MVRYLNHLTTCKNSYQHFVNVHIIHTFIISYLIITLHSELIEIKFNAPTKAEKVYSAKAQEFLRPRRHIQLIV